MVWFRDAGGVAEEIVGVERRALAEPPTAAVKLIPTFFEDKIDDGAPLLPYSAEKLLFSTLNS